MNVKLSAVLRVCAWSVAAAFTAKLVAALTGLPGLPDLSRGDAGHEVPEGESSPSLVAIVPARNEAEHIGAGLASLLAQSYPNLKILAVNDRSTDATGSVMESLAEQSPGRLEILHITELPPGWLGKTHAMAMAADKTASDLLFFTDADVIFAPEALALAVRRLLESGADHLILMPTTEVRRWDEAALMGLLHVLSLFAVPPWRVPRPRSRHALGVGAFCLVRRSAYNAVDGFAGLRMEVVEDLALGRRLKRQGFRTDLAFGRDLVRIHWAAGADGIVRVMTKNAFAAVGYRLSFIVLGCAGLAGMFVLPFAGVLLGATRVPSALAIAALTGLYWRMRRYSGISPLYALLAPFATPVLIFAMLRSTAYTLAQGGIVWRDTFYPLAELKRSAKLLQ